GPVCGQDVRAGAAAGRGRFSIRLVRLRVGLPLKTLVTSHAEHLSGANSIVQPGDSSERNSSSPILWETELPDSDRCRRRRANRSEAEVQQVLPHSGELPASEPLSMAPAPAVTPRHIRSPT